MISVPGESESMSEILDTLKQQLPNALKHCNDTVEIVEMIVEHRDDILQWLESNLGHIPEVNDIISSERDAIGTPGRHHIECLKITAQFLALWEKFLTSITLPLPQKPWVCPHCKWQNPHWNVRCIQRGEPKDLFGDDFTKRT